MTSDQIRQRFELWISSPPFEHMCDQWGEQSAWPGQYKRYETQLAWDAWLEAWREGRADLLQWQRNQSDD